MKLLTTLYVISLTVSSPTLVRAGDRDFVLRDVTIGNFTEIDIGVSEFFRDKNQDSAQLEMIIALPGLSGASDSYAELADQYLSAGRFLLPDGRQLGAAKQFLAYDHPGEVDGSQVDPRPTGLFGFGKSKFSELTLSPIDRNDDGDNRDLFDDAGNYVTALVSVLDRLTANKRGADGNYDFTRFAPVALIAHSTGGIVIQEAFDEFPEIDFEKRFGIRQVVFLAPVTSRDLPQTFFDTGDGVARGIKQFDRSGAFGFNDRPDGYVEFYCEGPDGISDDLDGDQLLAARAIREDSINVTSQVAAPVFDNGIFDNANLGAFIFASVTTAGDVLPAAIGGRPSVRRGLFAETGIEFSFIIGSRDIITPAEDVRAAAIYLTGSDVGVEIIPEETHCAYIDVPDVVIR